LANWTDIENQLANLLDDSYYRPKLKGESPRAFAHKCIQQAQGSALPAYSGEIKVMELKHPAAPEHPTHFVRGFDTTRSYSPFGGWWIDYALFDRFRRATATLPPAARDQKIKAFMRARSAVSKDWSNMAGIAELELPADARTPALVGKAHYQRLVTDTKHPDYVPNVFLMGGDLQFFVCIREESWIKH